MEKFWTVKDKGSNSSRNQIPALHLHTCTWCCHQATTCSSHQYFHHDLLAKTVSWWQNHERVPKSPKSAQVQGICIDPWGQQFFCPWTLCHGGLGIKRGCNGTEFRPWVIHWWLIGHGIKKVVSKADVLRYWIFDPGTFKLYVVAQQIGTQKMESHLVCSTSIWPWVISWSASRLSAGSCVCQNLPRNFFLSRLYFYPGILFRLHFFQITWSGCMVPVLVPVEYKLYWVPCKHSK